MVVCDTGTIKNLGSFATRDLEADEFLAEYHSHFLLFLCYDPHIGHK
eukprot:COSAG05_NODE_276_length_12393_cov_1737.505694_20_plen_47_part_00